MNRVATRYKGVFLLAYPSFWLWFAGETISSLGTNVTLIVMPWLVLSITHSALQSSTTMALEFLPYLFFSFFAGSAADRWDRKRLLMVTHLLRAVILVSLPILYAVHRLTIPDIYIAAFLNASAAVWFTAAQSSVLPQVLPATVIHKGNSMMQLGNSVASMLGPSIGGMLLGFFPAPWVLLADALSYVFAAICLSLIPEKLQHTVLSRAEDTHWLSGLRFVLREPLLRSSVTVSAISNFCNFASFSILVYYCREVLHLAPGWTAVVLGAFGVGLFVGSIVSAVMVRHYRSGTIMVASRFVAFIPSVLFAFVHSPVGLACAAALNGVWMVTWNVQSSSFRQIHVPDFMRGRVTSVNSMLAWIMIPLGSLVGGYLAQMTDCHTVFEMTAVIMVINAAFVWFSPLRRLGVRATLPAGYELAFVARRSEEMTV